MNIYAALRAAKQHRKYQDMQTLDYLLPLNFSMQAMGVFGVEQDGAPKLTMCSRGYISSQMIKKGRVRAHRS